MENKHNWILFQIQGHIYIAQHKLSLLQHVKESKATNLN